MNNDTGNSVPKILRSVHFMLGAGAAGQWPADDGLEIAFAGRSNVGKSSAINTITGRKNLARTSKTPGRTQQINFFGTDGGYRLVDLPGYGFARVPLEMRQHWEHLITQYIRDRKSLRGLILLMDSRHPLTELDKQMLEWTADVGLPIHVLLTKADKIKRNAAKNTLSTLRQNLIDYPGECSAQLFSSKARTGVAEAGQRIVDWFESEALPS